MTYSEIFLFIITVAVQEHNT